MQSVGDVVRYVPGISAHQGENNRDDVVIRGNRSSADFFVNGVRDDVQYYRDLYNLERIEALKGPNAMIFGRGGGGGVLEPRGEGAALPSAADAFAVELGGDDHKRATHGSQRAPRIRDGGPAQRHVRTLGKLPERRRSRAGRRESDHDLGAPHSGTKLTLGYEYLRDTRVADRGITSFQGRPAQVDPSTFYGDPEQSEVKARVNIGSAAFEQAIGRAVLRNRTVIAGYDRFYQNFVPGAASADQQTVALTAYNNATDRTNVFNQTDLTYTAHTGAVRHTLLAGVEVGRQLTDNFRNTGYFNNTVTSISVPFDASHDLDTGDVPPECDRRRQSRPHQRRRRVRSGSDRAVVAGAAARRDCGSIASTCSTTTTAPATSFSASTTSSRRVLASSTSRSRRCRCTAATACRTCRAPAISSRRSRPSPSRSSPSGSTTTRWARSGTSGRRCRSRPPSTGSTAPTRARPIPTIRPGSSRPAAREPTDSKPA